MSAHPDVPHMEFESVLRTSWHSELLVYRGLRNYRSVQKGHTYVARVWDRKGLADVERDRIVELLGEMAAHQRSSLLVQIHEALVDDHGRLVVVQDHVPLGSFRRHYRGFRWTVAEVVRFGVQLTGALSVLHRYTAHRRVEPSSVLLREVGDPDRFTCVPVLGGLEVAEVDDSAGLGLWRSRWASPAVRSGDGAGGRRDDLYSVAALMCSALTGDKPPSSAAHLPDTLRPDVPSSLMQVLRYAMEPPRPLENVTADMLLERLWKVERDLGNSPTPVDRPGPAPDFSTRSGSSDDDQWSAGGPRPVRIIEPPTGPQPGRAVPVSPGDPPGGPFPTIGSRPAQ